MITRLQNSRSKRWRKSPPFLYYSGATTPRGNALFLQQTRDASAPASGDGDARLIFLIGLRQAKVVHADPC